MFLEILQNSQEDSCVSSLSLFFNKVAGLRSATLFKKIFRHRSLLWVFNFLRTPFLQNMSRQLLLTPGIRLVLSSHIHNPVKKTIWSVLIIWNSQQLNTDNYFCRKLHLICFIVFWIRYQLSSLNTSLFFLLFLPVWINKFQKQSFTDAL